MIGEDEFLSRLTDIFRRELEKDDLVIAMPTKQSDIGNWDSLAHVRIVIGVEREFDITLEVSEIETIDSVQGFYQAVERHLR